MFLCWTALAICWLTKRSSILSACLHCALVLPSLWNSDNTNILLWISLNKAVCGGSGICQVFLISPNFIYFQKSMHILFSFFFACAGSSWTFSSCGAWTLHCGGFSCCRVWAQGTTGFWSCREWDLLLITWDLPGPGSKPMSPELACRFLTPGPTWTSHQISALTGNAQLFVQLTQFLWFMSQCLLICSRLGPRRNMSDVKWTPLFKPLNNTEAHEED